MSGKFQSILLGALVTGILGAAYFVTQFSFQSQILGTLACCVVPTAGALIAVWHFTTTNSLTIRAGEGAIIGLSAGLLGWLFSNILALIVSMIGVAPSPFDVEAIVEMARQNMVDQGQDPEVIDQAAEMTRNFFWAFAAIGLLAYAVFGAIIGAVGASVFKKGESPPV